MEATDEMRDFIEYYKSMPELWDNKNENYKNKNVRNRSYYKLLTVYRKIKRDSTVYEMKKKIANMRTCYRRELKKVINSKISGDETDDIYVSSLWYFEPFDFLRDLEMPLPASKNVEKKRVIKKPPIAKAKINFLKKDTDPLELSSKIARVEDDAAVYANGWACMYRQMSSNQQLFAKRAIDEILMLGRLDQLTFNTVQNISNETFTDTPSYSKCSPPYETSGTPVCFGDEL